MGGHASIFGLDSREEAIAWLERAFIEKLVWYKEPSVWIRQTLSYTEFKEMV